MEIQLSPESIRIKNPKPGTMQGIHTGLLSLAFLLICAAFLIEARPTIYMKNENDKLEPVLLPVSSTVIPIPVGPYQVSTRLGTKNGKVKKQKIKIAKPDGPTKLITVSGLKKMAAHEVIKPH